MHILLSGAKKNVGDFLIFDRAKKLLGHHLEDKEFVIVNRWEKLDEKIEMVNQAKSIILCGGPGYGKNFYPIIYPLTSPLEKIEVPIIPLGLGWGVNQFTQKDFKFSEESEEAIKFIHKRHETSVRDDFTLKMMNEQKISNIVMTGCPAWHDLKYVEKKFEKPKVKKIVITTPAGLNYINQSIKLMRLVKKSFPGVKILASFHRGIKRDELTPRKQSWGYQYLAFRARAMGLKVVDLAYDVKKLELYQDYDLHIGYRVHAHILFLSQRKPSILLHEDWRGKGLTETLKSSYDVSAFEEGTIKKMKEKIEKVKEEQYEGYYAITDYMRKTYHEKMVPFIKKIE